MKGPMKLIDASSGLMECRVCGSRHYASLQSGYLHANRVYQYYSGSWQCSNDQCPSNEKEWDGKKERYVKPNWRKLWKQKLDLPPAARVRDFREGPIGIAEEPTMLMSSHLPVMSISRCDPAPQDAGTEEKTMEEKVSAGQFRFKGDGGTPIRY